MGDTIAQAEEDAAKKAVAELSKANPSPDFKEGWEGKGEASVEDDEVVKLWKFSLSSISFFLFFLGGRKFSICL